MITLKKVGLDYLEQSSKVIATEFNVKAPVDFAFKVFGEADAWVHSFKSIEKVVWTTSPPHKKGARRTIDLKVPGQPILSIDEEFIAWEDNKRFSFYFKESSRRVFAAMVEDYQFSEGPNGSTNVNWRLAYEGAGIYRLVFKFLVSQVAKDNVVAMENFKALIEQRFEKG